MFTTYCVAALSAYAIVVMFAIAMCKAARRGDEAVLFTRPLIDLQRDGQTAGVGASTNS